MTASRKRVSSLPETMQTQAIGWALDRADSHPVAEVASWMAKHAHRSEGIAEAFECRVAAWSNSTPDAAIAWAVEDASRWGPPGGWDAIAEGSGREPINAWVEQNPPHPATEVLRQWLTPKEMNPERSDADPKATNSLRRWRIPPDPLRPNLSAKGTGLPSAKTLEIAR